MKRSLSLILCAIFLIIGILRCSSSPRHITIYYTSDTHGHIFADGEIIGFSVIASPKDLTPNAILLDDAIILITNDYILRGGDDYSHLADIIKG